MEDMSMLTGKTRNLGVMGWPIAHSLSPVLQNAAIVKAGLDYVYTALPVRPEQLSEAVNGLKALQFRGWNVTIPHKAAIIPLLDEIDEDARMIGAVNTVVNEVNWQEDLTSLISDLEPTRWKVLRMLPVVTKELALNDDQFQAFVDRHHILDSIMCVEGNDDMVQSYIMVDPHGRFFQNRSVGAGYDYSPLIIDMGALEAFDCMTWSAEKFVARYPRISK